jgi:hypothetical protein
VVIVVASAVKVDAVVKPNAAAAADDRCSTSRDQ